MNDLFGLTGKKAIVIGGGYGMGRAAARLLAEAGAAIAVVDLDAGRSAAEAADLMAKGHRAIGLTADVSRPHEAARVVAEAEQGLSGLDILVNIVGRNTWVPVLDMDPETLETVLSRNLKHHFYLGQAFAKTLRASGHGGQIVMVSSVSGVQAAPNHAAYGASKAALISLTKSMAAEWGPLGIRVNSIAPGTTRTDRNQWTPEIEARAAQTVPLGRVGDQTEIAKAALFLASDLASYITGQTLVVDGGATILSPSPFQ
ncbi:MAG: glucose 1-dehydrogenase [Dehalococcoidia bacterium]|nr:glucose 1-dehydrogenase [Dehalococcoidia bacterium]